MCIDRHLTEIPLLFQDNRIERFYLGGMQLNAWRRMPAPPADSHWCEELLVTSIGALSKGKPAGYAVSRTIPEQGELALTEILSAYPAEVLGEAFDAYNPRNLSVLARSGDTTVRLVMQCHPTQEAARRFFGMPMGKTEAWYIARTRKECADPCVYLGFKPHVTKELWRSLFERQDIAGMLSCLHRISVKEGDEILVPAGMAHCVGPGCLFVEYHECNDVTIRVERSINGLTVSDQEMFNGLDIDNGLGLFDYTTYEEQELRARCVMRQKVVWQDQGARVTSLIGPEQNESFELQLIELNGSYELPGFPGHRVLVSVDKDAELVTWEGESFALRQGHGALVPAACKRLRLRGEGARVTVGIPRIRN